MKKNILKKRNCSSSTNKVKQPQTTTRIARFNLTQISSQTMMSPQMKVSSFIQCDSRTLIEDKYNKSKYIMPWGLKYI